MHALLLAGLLVAQIPNGITVKDIYRNGGRIARSIEIRKVVPIAGTPTRYFCSRTCNFSGNDCLATIDSWSTMEGLPIRAAYRSPGLAIDVTFHENDVVFTTNGKKTTVPLIEGTPVLLSQLDPLILTRNLETKSVQCAVVVPEIGQVVPCTMTYQSKAEIRQGSDVRQGLLFAFKGHEGTSWITLDADGSFVRVREEVGLDVKVDHWRRGDERIFAMPKPDGLPE